MSDYTKVTLSVDKTPGRMEPARLQVNICASEGDGSGHGYRLAGPKYLGNSEPVLEVVLDERDVQEIRSYLAIWDEIQARKGGGWLVMAGAYCAYCDTRCFVPRRLPDEHSCSELCRASGHTWHMATCPSGMEHDRNVTGYDHTTAINPHAELKQPDGEVEALARAAGVLNDEEAHDGEGE